MHLRLMDRGAARLPGWAVWGLAAGFYFTALFHRNALGVAALDAEAVQVLADIRDARSVGRWFARERPEIVFHAAALKQVPIVEAFASEGVLTATSVEVKFKAGVGLPVHFSGAIETLPSAPNRVGDWKVAGRTIHVSTATKIDQSKGQVAVGVLVEVDGLLQTDGSINASEIEVKQENSGGIQVKFLGKIEKLPANNARVTKLASARLMSRPAPFWRTGAPASDKS